MLAVSSDIDSMTLENFRRVHRHLNARLGLDVANSVWFFATNARRGSQLAFFEGTSAQRTPYSRELAFYCRHGWIDSIHTYGNFSRHSARRLEFSRRLAEQAVAFSEATRLSFPVWVNHGDQGNVQNIGRQRYMAGDDPKSPDYHVDLMRQLGVRYVWDPARAVPFGSDSVLRPFNLRDGSRIWSFTRFHTMPVQQGQRALFERYNCKFWGQQHDHAVVWYTDAVPLQLSDANLSALVRSEQLVVIAQHLGYIRHSADHFTGESLAALERLANYQRRGDILVASTSALLEYNRVRDHLRFELHETQEGLIIELLLVDDPVLGPQRITRADEVRGITLIVDKPAQTFIALNGALVRESLIKRTTETIGIKWNEGARGDLVSRFFAQSAYHARRRRQVTGGPPQVEQRSQLRYARGSVEADGLRYAICVGGMKCGTTTLWQMVARHPRLRRSKKKEPNFFTQQDAEKRGLAAYREFWDLEGAATHDVMFEASTHYAKFPAVEHVGRRMKAIVPNAKIIYIVRHPVARLESQLAHSVSRGEVDVDAFLSGKWRAMKHLFNLSSYAMQLDQFRAYYSRDQIYIIRFEEFVSEPEKVLRQLFDYLAIESDVPVPKIRRANPRRDERDAWRVQFTADDQAYIIDRLWSDLQALEREYGFSLGPWGLN